MRIAICDDEKLYCDTVINLINEYKQTNTDVSFMFYSFSSGKELLNCIEENGNFDLYILDVIMPEMNGIQLGALLRDKNDEGMIIYLTTSPDYAVESYNIEALHYLLKPIDKLQFFQVMDKAFAYLDRKEKEVISIKTPDATRIVPVRNVLYAERIGRLVCYYLKDDITIKSVTFNDKFKNAIAPLLTHDGMILVGSSFVVNLHHVTEVTKTDLIISGGYRVMIPRRMYESVKAEWANYWLNGGYNHVL